VLATIGYFVTLGPVLRVDGDQQDLFTSVKRSVEAARRDSFGVVFLGNSRVMRGIDPAAIDVPSHNFGFDDDSFLYYGAKARWLARTGHRVRRAFVGVDIFQLGYWNYDRYFAYRELLEDPELDRWLFDRQYAPRLVSDLTERKAALRYFYRNALLNLAKSRVTGVKPTVNQFGEAYTLEPNGFYRVTYASRRHLDPSLAPRGPVDERGVALLDACVAALRAEGVEVVLFTPPASSEYRALRGSEERARFTDVVTAIASRNGARYVSWEADPAFSDDDFPDGIHLSIDGAARFSRMVSAFMQREP
jgi:hypothetical protein